MKITPTKAEWSAYDAWRAENGLGNDPARDVMAWAGLMFVEGLREGLRVGCEPPKPTSPS